MSMDFFHLQCIFFSRKENNLHTNENAFFSIATYLFNYNVLFNLELNNFFRPHQQG